MSSACAGWLAHTRQASCVREDGQDLKRVMLRLPWLLLLTTTAVLLLLLLDKWDIAAYPSGDSICVSVVAYLHLTTPASEVQCRPSRASILQHAGLESSPSCR